MKKVALMAHFGEDYLSYRENFLSFLETKGYIGVGIVPQDSYYKKVSESKYKVYFYKYIRSWKSIFYLLRTYIDVLGIFNKEKFDVLFTYKFFPNLTGILAARQAGIKKVVATVAGLGFLEKYSSSPFIFIIFKLYIKVLNKADFVIVQNKDDKDLLECYIYNAKLILTNGSGVDGKKFENLKIDTEHFYTANNLEKDKKYIVFCSRIVKQKGIRELIGGFESALKNNSFNYNLIIAGWFDEPKLETEIISKVDKNAKIHYLGYQKNVSILLTLASVIILPSYYPEGVPRSLTEALALGKPIITTNHKGCRETCIDGKNGYLVKPMSEKSITKSLLKFNSLQISELKSMSDFSKKLFYEKFEQNVVYQSIIDQIKLV